MALHSKAPIGAGMPNGVGAPVMPKSFPTLTLSQPGSPGNLFSKNWGGISEALAGAAPMFGAIGASGGSKNVWMGGGMYDSAVGSVMQGLSSVASQFNSPIAQAIGLGIGGAAGIVDMFGFNPDVDPINNSYASGAVPTFDLTKQRSSTNEFVERVREDTSKKVLSSAMGGFAAGAALSPIGGLIGGTVGLIGGLFGKKHATNKAIEAQQKMQNEYAGAVGRFNKAHEGYFGKENAAEKYQAKLMARGYGVPSSSPYLF